MKKPNDLEEDYFIRENLAAKHKLEQEHKRERHKEEEEKLKELHHMKCSKCGHDLEKKRLSYIDIDQCSNCGAIVLDQKDVDKFIAEEKSILKGLIDFFK